MVDVPENFQMPPEMMAQMQHQDNPLASYMRQPSIYIKLPSEGNWWAQGAIDMPINGEIPVLPMSTKDEIMLNTPDALLNGQAVVDVIKSCIPCIQNPWAIPTVDVDTILIAIRIASYGESMEYTSSCPQCENRDNYEIDLRQFMDMTVDLNGYLQPIDYKGMQIYLKPADYQTLNQQSLEGFEQQRMINVINDSTLSEEEKQRRFNEIFSILTDYTVKNITGSIRCIVTPDGKEVTNQQYIYNFVEQSERQLFDSIRKRIAEISEGFPEKQVNTKCDECSHEYTTPFTFDQSAFFDTAS